MKQRMRLIVEIDLEGDSEEVTSVDQAEVKKVLGEVLIGAYMKGFDTEVSVTPVGIGWEGEKVLDKLMV